MGTKIVAIRLPALSVQQLGDLDVEEKRLCRALSNCVEGHSSKYDEQIVLDYLRAFAVEIFIYYHGFYAEASGYKLEWAQIIKAHTVNRIMKCFLKECSAPAAKVKSYRREVNSTIEHHIKELVEEANAGILQRLREFQPKVNNPHKPQRLSATITSPTAAQKMQVYMNAHALGQTEFAIQAGTSDKTIRKFRQTGKIRRSILTGIASAMRITKEELLKS